MMTLRAHSLMLLLALLAAVPARAGDLEGRLREQLRATATKLRELEAQQGRLAADKAAAERERDTLRAELETLRAEGSRAARAEASLRNERAARAQTEASLQQLQAAQAQAQRSAQEHETQRQRLEAAGAAARQQLEACGSRNAELSTLGRELIDAYAGVGVGEVLARREPLLGFKRVRVENRVQAFEDRLQAGRYLPAEPAAP
jgi:chromosome segregation ATPase